jgi:2-(1,2-epoxy-1,2-dihydrophenyl)acetyl-CoA isomerase
VSEPILLTRRDAVATLTLNRPEAGNAIDVAFAQSLFNAVTEVEADPAIRCVLIRGEGRFFCVGGDVRKLHDAGSALPGLLLEILTYLHPAILRLARMDKPVITAIQGPAAGAGVGLAAVGDIALAEPAAHFTLAYSKIGLTPDAGATWLLPRLVGLRRAQELALANRRLSAEEAAAMGLITRVVAPGALTQEADALAASFAQAEGGVIGATKRLLLSADKASIEQQFDFELEAIVKQGAKAASQKAIAAFGAKR